MLHVGACCLPALWLQTDPGRPDGLTEPRTRPVTESRRTHDHSNVINAMFCPRVCVI